MTNTRYRKRGPEHMINGLIRAEELRVIDGGENLGVIKTKKALEIANSKGLDLVVISPKTNPPVAKILDYNKFLYAERKKQSASKAKSKKSELKEFKMRPTTDQGDIDRYTIRARKFIANGDRVKLSVRMRGRENSFPDVAIGKINNVAEKLEDIAKLESEPKRTGGTIWAVLVSK